MAYEYRTLSLPRQVDRGEVRAMLTRLAEYEDWELARSRLFPDGSRRIVVRRRAIRLARTR